MKKVAIITWSKEEELIVSKEYQHNPLLRSWLEQQSQFRASDSRIILPEDRLLISALADMGIKAETVSWKDASIDFSDYGLCIVRSVWLWHINPEKFLSLAETVQAKTQLWNSVDLMRWGSNKKYLVELLEKGIAITPSLSISAKSSVRLKQIIAKYQWNDIILKPNVSAGARDIIRVSTESKPGYKTLDEAELIFNQMLNSRDVIIQPYLNAIETEGEVSVIAIDGKITHAVRRLPEPNSFLALGYPLTTEELYPLDDDILKLCQNILKNIPYKMNFGRFDLIRGPNDKFLVSEIEVIAPRLFLQYSDTALKYWVGLIKQVVST